MITKQSKFAIIGISVILISLFALAYPVLADDVTVSRSMPSRVDPQGTLAVTFSINPTKTLTNFDLAELIPPTWSIKEWSVSGYDKNDVTFDSQESQTFLGSTYKGYHWKFNKALSSSASLTYTLNVPVSSGDYKFVGITTYPGGFNKDESTLTVATAPPTTVTTPPTTLETTTTQPVSKGKTNTLVITVVLIAIIAIFYLMMRKNTRKQQHHESQEHKI